MQKAGADSMDGTDGLAWGGSDGACTLEELLGEKGMRGTQCSQMGHASSRMGHACMGVWRSRRGGC